MPSDGLPKNLEPLAAGDPATIGPYVLAGRLGSGGMGTVYLGRSPEKGDQVAIKVIRPELAFDEATRARFRDEMENARRVASFCTAKILDHGTFENRPYMVTEYISGTALAEHIAKEGPLDSSTLHGFALGVAAALAAIHGSGLVHRDLKPANVILSLSGPRVIDFGIARALNTVTSHTQTGIVMGSPGWMAPEQLLEEKVTTAADIFAWGCLVAFAGNGVHPFGNGDAMTLGKRMLFAEPQIGSLDSPLDRLVARALAKEADRRPKAQDLLLELAGGSSDNSDANDMVSHALHQSWRPNLPPLPPMPQQPPPPGGAQPAPGGRPAPGSQPPPPPPYPGQAGPPPAQPPQQPPPPVPPGAGQGGGNAAPPSQPPHGAPVQQPQQAGHHTGQFPTVGPHHTGPVPPVSGGPPPQQPSRPHAAPGAPQSQPYVPPVAPPPHTPLQPSRRRIKWLVAIGAIGVILALLVFGLLVQFGSTGFGLTGSAPEEGEGAAASQEPSSGAPSDSLSDSPTSSSTAPQGHADGPVRFTLRDFECGPELRGRSTVHNGQYCVVPVTVENTSNEPIRLQPEWQKIGPLGGALHSAEQPTPQEAQASLWQTIPPHERAEGRIVFILDDDITPTRLLLRGQESSDGVRVDLEQRQEALDSTPT
ncbi:serine/threonine-protein kinase [Salinactinospora qingdaonensis]|uniref:serine/threonine-protein kinase n=1 Tax=Salinactinospora qingdaonensis TaxID=702744 RepID=UPI0031E7ECF8